MTGYAAEVYKQITGFDPPKPFDQKTPEEQLRDRDRFLASLETLNVDDQTIDEFFESARMKDLVLRAPDLTDDQAESA